MALSHLDELPVTIARDVVVSALGFRYPSSFRGNPASEIGHFAGINERRSLNRAICPELPRVSVIITDPTSRGPVRIRFDTCGSRTTCTGFVRSEIEREFERNSGSIKRVSGERVILLGIIGERDKTAIKRNVRRHKTAPLKRCLFRERNKEAKLLNKRYARRGIPAVFQFNK